MVRGPEVHVLYTSLSIGIGFGLCHAIEFSKSLTRLVFLLFLVVL